MNINFPETGYTPANLRAIQRDTGLRREALAKLCGKSLRAIQAYCMENRDSDNAKDMPSNTWAELLRNLDILESNMPHFEVSRRAAELAYEEDANHIVGGIDGQWAIAHKEDDGRIAQMAGYTFEIDSAGILPASIEANIQSMLDAGVFDELGRVRELMKSITDSTHN